MSMLEARAVVRRPALRGADLTVAAGEIVAVTGPPGAGKSTLLRCCAGVLGPEHGAVYFDGRRLDTMPEPARTALRRAAFGVVHPPGHLVPELTVADNIALPLLLNGAGRGRADATVAAWLRRLGLAGLGERRPRELTPEHGRLAALGRALAVRPRILFADEPPGPLDLILGLARAEGIALLLVTHDARAAGFADRRVVMTGGRVYREPAPALEPVGAATGPARA